MKSQMKYFSITLLIFQLVFTLSGFCSDSLDRDDLKPSDRIKDIVVTAQKRKENVSDIPMSITAFSDIMIEDADINNVNELTLFAPNLHMKSGTSSNVVIIRGISNDADYIHSTTSLYVDDISYPMNFMHNPTLFDIERIEVLRGPQGTLYGRNSESGVINIVTRQPTNQFSGKVSGRIGVYDAEHDTVMAYKTGLSLSGPVVEDRLFMGIAGDFQTSDGFMKNMVTDNEKAGSIDHKNGRWTTLWTPSDNLGVTAVFDFLDTDDANANKRYIEGPWASGRHGVLYDTDNNVNEQAGDGQSLKIKYRNDSFSILSITGRRFYENHMLRDGMCSPVDDGINDLTYSSDLLSQEFRISSPDNGGPLEWLGGVYLFKEKNVTDIDTPVSMEIRDTDMETRSWAVFGQGTFTLFDRLHLTAGLRFNTDEMDATMDYTTSSREFRTFNSEFDETVFLPKFSLAYDVMEQTMAYATFAKGYNTGGFNTAFATGTDNFTYASEYTRNFEVGLKSTWLNNRLGINLALFYIDIDDKQVAERDGISDAMRVRNAAKAHSQGLELEVSATPLQGVRVFAGLGYTHVEFDDWVTADFDYGGKTLPNAPEFTGSLGLQYRHPSGFFGRTDLLYTDTCYSDAQNTQLLGSKTLVNLRAGYEGDGYDIVFWCKNLFDQEYETIGFARRNDLVIDGAPRMAGVTLTYYF